jgi:hypothetical protein
VAYETSSTAIGYGLFTRPSLRKASGRDASYANGLGCAAAAVLVGAL